MSPRDPVGALLLFSAVVAAQYRRAENVLVIRGNRDLAHAFLENWERHRAHSAPYGESCR